LSITRLTYSVVDRTEQSAGCRVKKLLKTIGRGTAKAAGNGAKQIEIYGTLRASKAARGII
jgi:hypothetical protein